MIRCPYCPVCGKPPMLLLGEDQWFCGNDACRVLAWNPTKTAAEILSSEPDR